MMRRFALILSLLLLLSPGALAEETPLYAWTLQKGGDGISAAAAMAIASRGGVFIVGATNDEDFGFGESKGGKDGFVLRVDGEGQVLWQGRYGGSGADAFTHVVETADGGCVAMGLTYSTDGDAQAGRGGADAFLVRLDADGALLWSKCLGGTLDDELLSIFQTDGGNLLVCGHTRSRNGDLGANFGGYDAWAAHLDGETGKPLWVIRHGVGGDDRFTHALPAEDGCLLLGEIAEETAAAEGEIATWVGRPVAMLVSLEGGEAIWQVTLGGTGDNALLCAQGTDGGWLLAGSTNSRSALMPVVRGGLDVWTLLLRQSGTVSWQRTYGGSDDEEAYATLAAARGGTVLLATTASNDGQVRGAHGGDDVWVVKTSSTGALEWQQALGGRDASRPVGLVQTADGGYLVAGTSLSQDGDIGAHVSVRTGFLARLAENGNLLETMLIGEDEECTLVDIQSRDGVIYLLGGLRTIDGGAPREDVWLARLTAEGM